MTQQKKALLWKIMLFATAAMCIMGSGIYGALYLFLNRPGTITMTFHNQQDEGDDMWIDGTILLKRADGKPMEQKEWHKPKDHDERPGYHEYELEAGHYIAVFFPEVTCSKKLGCHTCIKADMQWAMDFVLFPGDQISLPAHEQSLLQTELNCMGLSGDEVLEVPDFTYAPTDLVTQ